MLLGREDLADPHLTGKWVAYERALGRRTLAINGKLVGSVRNALPLLHELGGERRTTRAMVVGIPNTGKSTVINALAKRTAAKAEDKAGVTRSLSWFRISPHVGGHGYARHSCRRRSKRSTLSGSSRCATRFRATVTMRKRSWRGSRFGPRSTVARYPTSKRLPGRRGFLQRANELDLHTAAAAFVKDFNLAKFGRITFEMPPPPPGEALQ